MRSMSRALAALLLPAALLNPSLTWAAASAKEMATEVSAGLGLISRTHEGHTGRVIIFEERHNSILAQIEVAHMLLRLHKRYGMNQVGLEGAFASNGGLKPAWIDNLKGPAKLDTLAMHLAQGEINSAEFIATAFPSVAVTGIDDRLGYAAELRDEDASAGFFYLVSISEAKASDAQIEQFQRLTRQGKRKEAIEVLFQADDWTKRKYDQMNRTNGAMSTEAMAQLLIEIEKEATIRHVAIDRKLTASMKRLQTFFNAASQRSDAMSQGALSLARRTPDLPISIIIGAAHTDRIATLLQAADASFAVITPQALAKEQPTATLAHDAYKRKEIGQSVDGVGGVGALLDGRVNRKPAPVVTTLWFQSKAELHFATVELVREVIAKGIPPPDSLPQLGQLSNVKIQMDSLELKGDELVFRAQVKGQNGSWKDIWVRAASCETCKTTDPIQRRIESLLAEANGGSGGKGPTARKKASADNEDANSGEKRTGKKEPGPKESKMQEARQGTKRISQDTIAMFSNEHAGVRESLYSS